MGCLNENQLISLKQYQKIRNNQKTLEDLPVVAYGGTKGSYSEDAAIKYFGEKATRIACRAFEDVIKSVESENADVGILPVENSTTGAVRDVSEMILKSNLEISGEIRLDVHHCLMVLPGTKKNEITKVYSHQQSLYQCKEYLKQYPEWVQQSFVNNAYAAKEVAEGENRHHACIASERCAGIYHLEILDRNINTKGENSTRFLLITKGVALPEETLRRKVSLSFGTPHQPGALYKVLGIFEAYQLNLTRIESRPSGESNWEYDFFVDFSGEFSNAEMDRFIEELIQNTVRFRFLGCFIEN